MGSVGNGGEDVVPSDLTPPPLLAAPHFYWGCCMVCRLAATPETPLKRCSKCACIFYCSQEHQRSHWKQHRKMCSYLATAAEEIGADNFFGKGPDAEEEEYEVNDGDEIEDKTSKWRRFRTNAIQTCQILLGRALEEWEKEMFLFPRACRRCHVSRRDGMLDCPDCMGASYCSQQCRDEDRDLHQGRRCMELRFAMACDNFECSVNVAAPALPSEVDTEYTPLPKDVESYLDEAVGKAEGLGGLELMERKFLSDRVSGPLSIVHTMQKFGLASGESAARSAGLTLHVVGANIMEMLGLIKWELIAHKLPACSDLRVIFVGPELESNGEEEEGECPGIGSCQDCSDRGRSLTYEIRKCPYQDYSRSQHYRPPDLVAAFNCGFHEFRELPEKDTWKPALPYLVRHVGVPLVFTSYTASEAQRDLSLIRELELNGQLSGPLLVEAAGERNPYRSHRPIRDFEVDGGNDCFFNNNYYSVVRLGQEDA